MIWLFIATIVVELTLFIPSQSHRVGIIGAVKNTSFFMGVREEEEEGEKKMLQNKLCHFLRKRRG